MAPDSRKYSRLVDDSSSPPAPPSYDGGYTNDSLSPVDGPHDKPPPSHQGAYHHSSGGQERRYLTQSILLPHHDHDNDGLLPSPSNTQPLPRAKYPLTLKEGVDRDLPPSAHQKSVVFDDAFPIEHTYPPDPYYCENPAAKDELQQQILEELDDSHLDRKFESQPSLGPSAYQREQFEQDAPYYGNAPLRHASVSLKKRLSKARRPPSQIGGHDGGVSVPLTAGNGNSGGDGGNEDGGGAYKGGFTESAGGGPGRGASQDGEYRTIYINAPEKNLSSKFIHNRVSTAKYNMLTFLPKFLFEQFSKYANLFFLFTSCIQQIPNVSPTSRWTTLAPLLVVLTATALKELAEDRKRHNSDKEMNRSATRVLEGGQFVEKPWRDVVVGDIVRVENKDAIPADIVILSSSEPEGLCYIETSNLDGETNLKVKQARPETAVLLKPQDLTGLAGYIKSETPNDSLYTYQGTLVCERGLPGVTGRKEIPLDPTQVLLRGAILRNTNWVFAVVVFTGHDTKLMRNATATPIKQTHMEKTTNKQIVFLFIILISLSVSCTVGSYVIQHNDYEQLQYLELPKSSGAKGFVKNILTFIILYNNLIPISLIVTMEFV
ncbi:aminophospholipid translocase, partial [Spiromyces aspiralis]